MRAQGRLLAAQLRSQRVHPRSTLTICLFNTLTFLLTSALVHNGDVSSETLTSRHTRFQPYLLANPTTAGAYDVDGDNDRTNCTTRQLKDATTEARFKRCWRRPSPLTTKGWNAPPAYVPSGIRSCRTMTAPCTRTSAGFDRPSACPTAEHSTLRASIERCPSYERRTVASQAVSHPAEVAARHLMIGSHADGCQQRSRCVRTWTNHSIKGDCSPEASLARQLQTSRHNQRRPMHTRHASHQASLLKPGGKPLRDCT